MTFALCAVKYVAYLFYNILNTCLTGEDMATKYLIFEKYFHIYDYIFNSIWNFYSRDPQIIFEYFFVA